MLTFHIYCLTTLVITFYLFISLYYKEKEIFLLAMYFVKSKVHFFLILNFCFMITLVLGKILIKLFYDEVRLSEMMQVIEKGRMKLFIFFLLFATIRPNVDLFKILMMMVYLFMQIITLIGFKRASYIISVNDKSKKVQAKIVVVYICLLCMTYTVYLMIDPIDFSSIPEMTSSNSPVILDSLIYFIIRSEFLFLLMKLGVKFIKLIMDITAINFGKTWDMRLPVFSSISLINYVSKIICEIKFSVYVNKVGAPPVFFIIDIIYSFWNAIKLATRIYDKCKTDNFINNLPDYILPEIKEEENVFISNEELKKRRNEDLIICNVCLGEIEHGKFLTCGHVFHLKCIKGWVIGNTNCPICKSSIISDGKPNTNFYSKQVGIPQEKPEETEEEKLEKIDININIASIYIPKHCPELIKYNYYRRTMKAFEANILGRENTKIETGGISYSPPCQAVYNRSFKGEVKRLEIEFLNRQLIDLYENPYAALVKDEESQ